MQTRSLNFSQQHKLLDPKAARPVTLIGAGAVGSHVALALAKMGVPKLKVWDDDDVSEHNVPMSLYRPKDFMRPKVDALREIVEEFSGLVIDAHRAKYEGETPLEGSVVMCVDSMDARRRIWKAVCRMDTDVDLLIDTRTAAKLLWVFSIRPYDPDDAYYAHHVSYGTREAAPHMCGTHGFMPMSLMAAACVAENLTSWWMSGKKEMHRRQLVASPSAAEEDA